MTAEFKIYLLTWNVAEKLPPYDLTKLLGLVQNESGKDLPDIYAIGLQEMKSDTTSLLTDSIFDDPWTTAITNDLSVWDYVRIKSLRLVGIHLGVYVKRRHLYSVSKVESEFTRTGLGGLWGNKGGVSIRFEVNGVNMCFINSHLSAHRENFAQRIEDYNQIVMTQKFRDHNSPSILDHDYVFWLGDLNFRLDDVDIDVCKKKIQIKDLKYLLQHDQLNHAKLKELILIDFDEGDITFPPTYKFNHDTDVYDTSVKQRVPAWCDRILWRVHEDSFEGTTLKAHQLHYNSIPSYKQSDHKPVAATFKVKVLDTSIAPPVLFEPLSSWCRNKDQKVYFSILRGFPTSGRDWIGLYPSNFKHFEDYHAYSWLGARSADQYDDTAFLFSVPFEERFLDKLPPGKYVMLYFSVNKNCVVSYSNNFKLIDGFESSSESEDGEDRRRSLMITTSSRQRSQASRSAIERRKEANSRVNKGFHSGEVAERFEEAVQVQKVLKTNTSNVLRKEGGVGSGGGGGVGAGGVGVGGGSGGGGVVGVGGGSGSGGRGAIDGTEVGAMATGGSGGSVAKTGSSGGGATGGGSGSAGKGGSGSDGKGGSGGIDESGSVVFGSGGIGESVDRVNKVVSVQGVKIAANAFEDAYMKLRDEGYKEKEKEIDHLIANSKDHKYEKDINLQITEQLDEEAKRLRMEAVDQLILNTHLDNIAEDFDDLVGLCDAEEEKEDDGGVIKAKNEFKLLIDEKIEDKVDFFGKFDDEVKEKMDEKGWKFDDEVKEKMDEKGCKFDDEVEVKMDVKEWKFDDEVKEKMDVKEWKFDDEVKEKMDVKEWKFDDEVKEKMDEKGGKLDDKVDCELIKMTNTGPTGCFRTVSYMDDLNSGLVMGEEVQRNFDLQEDVRRAFDGYDLKEEKEVEDERGVLMKKEISASHFDDWNDLPTTTSSPDQLPFQKLSQYTVKSSTSATDKPIKKDMSLNDFEIVDKQYESFEDISMISKNVLRDVENMNNNERKKTIIGTNNGGVVKQPATSINPSDTKQPPIDPHNTLPATSQYPFEDAYMELRRKAMEEKGTKKEAVRQQEMDGETEKRMEGMIVLQNLDDFSECLDLNPSGRMKMREVDEERWKEEGKGGDIKVTKEHGLLIKDQVDGGGKDGAYDGGYKAFNVGGNVDVKQGVSVGVSQGVNVGFKDGESTNMDLFEVKMDPSTENLEIFQKKSSENKVLHTDG